MGREARDWKGEPVEVCYSCEVGDHLCVMTTLGYACSCEVCAEALETTKVEAAEFFNGLEDFFKSIDPDRVGWETIEAEAHAGDAGDQVS